MLCKTFDINVARNHSSPSIHDYVILIYDQVSNVVLDFNESDYFKFREKFNWEKISQLSHLDG